MAWTFAPQQAKWMDGTLADDHGNIQFFQAGWSDIDGASDSQQTPDAKRIRCLDDHQKSNGCVPPSRSYDFRSQPWNQTEAEMSQSLLQQPIHSGQSLDKLPWVSSGTIDQLHSKPRMRTGCIPCLIQGIACSPQNPNCKLSMLEDWESSDRTTEIHNFYDTPAGSLTSIRPYTKWRRSWRERHSLNFFATFTAPQLAGFFDSSFWQRIVIQTSFHEPAVLHAITAIGALHESIVHRSSDDNRRAHAMEFALAQCNKAISCLTTAQRGALFRDLAHEGTSRLALITCVLFTCFEAMQGRSNSAVNHALQGRALLAASGAQKSLTHPASGDEDVEQLRPIVERLEVQATSLLVKNKRPEDHIHKPMPAPMVVDVLHSLEHAHDTLHGGLNNIMRFSLSFKQTVPSEVCAETIEEQQQLAAWVAGWETAFSTLLARTRSGMSDLDRSRASVLQVNYLVAKILSNVNHLKGNAAFDLFEADFRTMVDLSRGVLTAFSCPPLPTLSGGSAGAPYVSFSLWVTDPLWIAATRCRTNSIRHAAFTMLAQNPRQEGIWHAGPQSLPAKPARQIETTMPSKNGSGMKSKAIKRSWTEAKSSSHGTIRTPAMQAPAGADGGPLSAQRLRIDSTAGDSERIDSICS